MSNDMPISATKPAPTEDSREPSVSGDAAAPEKMDPELKAKWVAALRSGQFQQAREALRSRHEHEVAYCCLGVLCTLIPEVHFTVDDAYYQDEIGEKHDADGELPLPVREIAKIGTKTVIRLIQMNDGKDDRPHSFSEIADYIEENL
jgi:hypothetical protein